MRTSRVPEMDAEVGRRIFDAAPVGMALASHDLRILRVNQAFCKFLGYSRKELLGMTIRQITHPADWALSSKEIGRVWSQAPKMRQIEKRYIHKSGQIVWGQVSARLIPARRGKPRFHIAQVLDITERKRTEEELRRSEERFRLALQGTPATIFSQDRKLRYTWVYNPSPEFKGDDILGKRDGDIFEPRDARAFKAIKRQVMKTGAPRRDEVATHFKGHARIHDMTTEPLRDDRGRIVGVICAAFDITDRKEVEVRLRRQAQIIDQVHDAVVSTDLKGRVTSWNKGAEMMFGYTAEEARGKHIALVYPEDQRRFLRDELMAKLKRKGESRAEVWVQRKSGDRVCVDLSLSLLRDDCGKAYGMIGYSKEITERRLAAEELRRREETLSALLNACTEPIMMLDTAGIVLSVNAAMLKKLGVAAKDFVGKPALSFVAPELARTRGERIREVIRTGKPLRFDDERAGRIMANHIYPVFGSTGEVTGVAIFAQERTEAKRLEEERDRILNSSIDLICIASVDGYFTYVNPAWQKTLGYTRDELLSQPFLNFVHPEERTITGREVASVLSGRPAESFEIRCIHKDGSIRTISWTASAMTPQGLLYCIGRDVTDRKRVEDKVRDSEAKYRMLHESMMDAYVKVDMSGRIIEVNPAYCKLLGYSAEEIRRLTYVDLTPAKWHAFEAKIVRDEILPRGHSRVYEKEYRRKDGTVLPVELRTFLLKDAAGRPAAMWAIVRDITERKQAAAKLQKAHEELEQKVRDRTAKLRALAVQLNHAEELERQRIAQILHEELQQIIMGTRLMLNGLKRDDLSKRGRHQALRRIDDQLERVHQMMRSLCVELHPPVLHEAGLCAALKWLRDDMKDKFGLAVELDVKGSVEPATSSLRSFIFQSVRELLFNVVKHAGVKSARVRLKPIDADRMLVEVTDKGRGFDPRQTGLNSFGLFSVRERADYLGGRLTIQSAAGKGACIRLALPRL